MKFRFALFDQSTRDRNNDYWTWLHPELSTSLLKRVYNEFISQNPLEKPQDTRPETIHGGVALIGEWICLYRIVNGGKDTFGREGRFVPICVFAHAADVRGYNCAAVLDAPPVQNLVALALNNCPVPAPASLEFDADMPVAREVDSAVEQLMKSGQLNIFRDDALEIAGSVIAALDQSRPFHCRLLRSATKTEAKISYLPTHEVPALTVRNAPDAENYMPSRPNLNGGGTDAISANTAGGMPSYWTPKICVVVGLVCLILGLIGGYFARARLFSIPVAVPDQEFVINHRRDTEQPSKYWIEFIPKGLRIEKWYVDGKEYDGQPVDVKMPLAVGDHTVEVDYVYREKNTRGSLRRLRW